GTWFFDVHPPLGKLMFAAAGWLAGYDGSFSFKEIHMDYLKHDVPYVAMRMVSAISGAMLVPLAYKTL
ncbi:dolichyl-phosphate-mannose-protein mannosyltransferase, partial [Sphaeroforma arctica JP610]